MITNNTFVLSMDIKDKINFNPKVGNNGHNSATDIQNVYLYVQVRSITK